METKRYAASLPQISSSASSPAVQSILWTAKAPVRLFGNALIHQHFVKSGKLSKDQGKNLNWLFELRSVCDYGVSLHVALKDARRAVDTAEDFIGAVKALLNS